MVLTLSGRAVNSAVAILDWGDIVMALRGTGLKGTGGRGGAGRLGGLGAAQVGFPPGYGGWYGWGANTAYGDAARGMGAFAAGAGAYNEMTARAASINTDTGMRLNEYIWESQQLRNQRYYQQLAARRERVNETAATTFDRLRNNPETRDVRTGDALNVVLDELTDPKVYIQSLKGAQQAVDSRLVKNIPFQKASAAVTISLNELSRSGVPDVLKTTPALEAERTALRGGRRHGEAGSRREGRGLLGDAGRRPGQDRSHAAQGREVVPQGTRQRREAENFLRALYGLTHMLETPQIDQFLRGLDETPTTTLGHLISFMNTFNLRFGASSTPAQQAAYTQLFPMLVSLRDQVNPEGSNPLAVQIDPEDTRKATEFFSNMPIESLQHPPALGASPAPAPPAPAPPAAPPAPGTP